MLGLLQHPHAGFTQSVSCVLASPGVAVRFLTMLPCCPFCAQMKVPENLGRFAVRHGE